MKDNFTIAELMGLKNICVKAQNFELAAKCRELEQSHPDYVPPKKKRGRPRKSDWIITTSFKKGYIKKYGSKEYKKIEMLLLASRPTGNPIYFTEPKPKTN